MTDRRGIEWRARARERLEPIVADVHAERTTLGWFDVERLLDGRDPTNGFRWSALFMRRTIGLPALQELAAATHDGRRLTPIEAVTRVVDRMVAVGREGWADRDGAEPEDWLRSVGEGGRAAAIRDAVTWVTACRTQLMWPPRDIRARGEGTAYATVRKDVLSLSTRIDLGSWKQPGVIEPSAPTEHTRAKPRVHRARSHDGHGRDPGVGHGVAPRVRRSHDCRDRQCGTRRGARPLHLRAHPVGRRD